MVAKSDQLYQCPVAVAEYHHQTEAMPEATVETVAQLSQVAGKQVASVVASEAWVGALPEV